MAAANTPALQEEGLERGLKDRHVQMIALGGAIGVGLFLGSGAAIDRAGPGLVIAYLLGGVAIFFMMRALGEMALHQPVAGSFTTYAERYVGPLAGFFTGWTYWIGWLVTGMAELTAAGIYVNYWWDIPQWVPALVFLVGLYGVNLISVRLFGEFEFWFAIVKVMTIVGIILLGLAVLLFGFGDLGGSASFSHLWDQGGFLPNGFGEVFLVLQIVMFAYFGVELVGVTAGEAANPEKTLPSAINKVILRILLFYVGALVIIMSLVAWNQLDPEGSPFVFVFDRIGIPAAAGIINFVVLTAALSSCNSGLFSTGRMLLTLSRFGQAPARFGRLSPRKVPANAMTVSAVVLLVGVVINYLIPEKAFAYITSVSTIAALWTWGIISLAHRGFRKAASEGRVDAPTRFLMPGYPVANWFVLAFMAMVAVLLLFDADTRIAWYVAPFWTAAVLIGWRVLKARRGRVPAAGSPAAVARPLATR
jgi:amino acid transporter, AAT family